MVLHSDFKIAMNVVHEILKARMNEFPGSNVVYKGYYLGVIGIFYVGDESQESILVSSKLCQIPKLRKPVRHGHLWPNSSKETDR